MTTTEQGTRVTITVGEQTTRYELWTTRVERAYDGFGTLEVYDSGEQPNEKRTRYVLIDLAHVEWQTMRYASGLGAPAPADDIDARSIERWFWNRITGEE